MPGGGESVAPHSSIVLRLVGRLPKGCQPHDHVTVSDAGGIDHLLAPHAAGDGAVDDHRPNEVAHVGGLSAGIVDPDAEVPELLEELVRAIDQRADHLTRDEPAIAPDGGGVEQALCGTDAEEVVEIHHDGVLRDTAPDG